MSRVFSTRLEPLNCENSVKKSFMSVVCRLFYTFIFFIMLAASGLSFWSYRCPETRESDFRKSWRGSIPTPSRTQLTGFGGSFILSAGWRTQFWFKSKKKIIFKFISWIPRNMRKLIPNFSLGERVGWGWGDLCKCHDFYITSRKFCLFFGIHNLEKI